MFGKGLYYLPHLIEKGEPYDISSLSDEAIRRLASMPKGSPNYVAKALLYRTELQIEDYLKTFNLLHAGYEKGHYSFTEEIGVEWTKYGNKDCIRIDLSCFKALKASKLLPDKHYSLKLSANGKCVGYLFFKNQKATLISQNNLIICGKDNLRSLYIHSVAEVFIVDTLLVTEELRIVSKSLECMSKGTKPLVETQLLDINSFQHCKIDAIVKSTHSRIKAGFCLVAQEMECFDSLFILAEQVEVHKTVAAKKQLLIVSIDLQQRAQGSHVHAEQITIVAANKVDLQGIVSTKALSVYAEAINLGSGIFVEGDVHLKAYGEKAYIGVSEIAVLYVSGTYKSESAGLSHFAGKRKNSTGLRWTWKNIIHPDLRLNAIEAQKVDKGICPFYVDKTALAIRFFPFIKPEEARFYPLESFYPFWVPLTKDLAPSLQNKMECTASYLFVDGSFDCTDGVTLHFNASYDLSFSGNIWGNGFFYSELLFEAKQELSLEESSIKTAGSFFVNAQDLKVSSQIEVSKIGMKAQNIDFPQHAELKAEHIALIAEERVSLPPKSHLSIQSSSPAWIICKDFYMHKDSELQFQNLCLQASHLVRVYKGKIEGNYFNLECEFLIAGLSRFLIKKKFSLTAIASILGLCQIMGDYSSNTLINLSLSLYTPGELDLDVKSISRLLLAAANTSLSILHLVTADPALQTGIVIARFALNALPALVSAVGLANSIYKTAANSNTDRASLIKMANQVKTLAFSLTGLGLGVSGFTDAMIAGLPFGSPSLGDFLSLLNQVNTAIAPLVAMAQSGKQVNSFFSVDFDADLSLISVSDNSLFSIHGSSGLCLYSSRRALFSMEANPASLSLYPNASRMGLVDFSVAKDGLLPIGSTTQQFLESYSYSFVPIAEQGLSIEASRFNCIGPHQYVNTAIAVKELDEEGNFQIKTSSLTAERVINHDKIKSQGSKIEVGSWYNKEGSTALVIASDFTAKRMELPKESAFQTFGSKIHIKQLRSEDGIFASDRSSIEGHDFYFSDGSKMGSRSSNWNVDSMRAKAFDLELENKDSFSPQLDKRSGLIKDTPLQYVSTSDLYAIFVEGGYGDEIVYASSNTLLIKNRKIVSVLPLGFEAPAIEFRGYNSSSAPLDLYTQNLYWAKAQNQFQGDVRIYADKMTMDGGKTQVYGQLSLEGGDLLIGQGAQLSTSGEIDDFFKKTTIQGKKTQVKTEKTHHGFFSTTKTTTITTQFTNAVLKSDKAIVIQGESAELQGADLLANKIRLSLSKELTIDGQKGENSIHQDKSTLISHHHDKTNTEQGFASQVLGSEEIEIRTTHLRIDGSDVAAPKCRIIAHTFTGSCPILKTVKEVSDTGLQFDLPPLPKLEEVPVIAGVKQVSDANNGLSLASSLVHLGTTVTNNSAALVDSFCKKDIWSGLQDITGYNPSLHISLGKSKSRFFTEHKGDGGIFANDLYVEADSVSLLNDFALQASQAEIHVGQFSATAATLHCDYKASSFQLIDNIGFNGHDFGLAFAYSKDSLVYHQGNGLRFEQLNLDVHEMDLFGVVPQVEVLQGNIRQLHFHVLPNEEETRSYGGSLFASGAFSFDSSKGRIQQFVNASPFGMEMGPQEALPIFDIRNSFHISGSLFQPPTAIFSSINVQTTDDNYSAIQQGELIHSLKDSHSSYNLDLPIYHPKASKTFLSNIHSMSAKPSPQQEPRQETLEPKIDNNKSFSTEKNTPENQSPDLVIDFVALYQAQQREENYWGSFVDSIAQDDKTERHSPHWFELCDPKELGDFSRKMYRSTDPEIPFAIAKINLLKSWAYGFYGLSAALNLRAIYKADNHFEEACHVGFLMCTGSAGWEAGVVTAEVASTVCACAASLPFVIIMGICGSVVVNMGANMTWDAYVDKIKENVDRDKTVGVSILPWSIFNANKNSAYQLSQDIEDLSNSSILKPP